MKRFFCRVWCVLEGLGYARAASELARAGRYEDAKRLTLSQKGCDC